MALGSVLSIVLLGTILYQTDLIGELKQGLNTERRRADNAEEELQVKNDMVEQLSTENQLLQDSIEGLKLEIATLEETIQQQKTQIGSLNRIISTQENKVTRLSQKIEELEGNSAANIRKIQQLEAEREAVLQDMAKMDQLRTELQQAHVEINRLKAAAANTRVAGGQSQTSPAPQRRNQEQQPAVPVVIPETTGGSSQPAAASTPNAKLPEVLAQTNVIYHEVTLQKKKTGPNIKEIDARNWFFTNDNHDLDHPDKNILVGKEFVLMIHDADTKVVVRMNEENPGFPDSQSGALGYLFRYRGEPIQIRYFNTQEKDGSNYEIRLYHVNGGNYVELPNGAHQMVKGRKVVAN